jgi:(2Fe-2S) ferredoxin
VAPRSVSVRSVPTVDCLGPCSRSNVVVVRRDGVRRWFGQILDDEVTQALAGWVHEGASEPLPALVAVHEFVPEPRHQTDVELVASPSS